MEAAKPVLAPKDKPKQKKPVKHAGDLQDYTYERSLPELARVKQEQPKAGGSVSTDMSKTQLTWEEYDKLTPDQRAAVDFNSLLVQAREIDLKTAASGTDWYTDAQKKQYALDVASIFGEAGGSETMGYRTVELLKKINFTAVGQDLDEYLSLERAVTAEELKNFKFSGDEAKQLSSFNVSSLAKPGIAGDYQAARAPENLAAIDTAAIQAALETYKKRVVEIGANARDIVTGLGIQLPAPMMMPPGYERAGEYESKLDESFKQIYNFLRQYPTEEGLASLFQDFKSQNWEPEAQQQLWAYLNDRTMRERQYFNDEGAEQIRTILGWD